MRAGDRVTIRKYGKLYPATVVKIGRVNVVVRFTQASGRVVERTIPQAAVVR